MAKTKPVPLSKMSSAARAKRVAALVKNPGTRSAVPTEYLPPELRAKRELNARLNAPITPGSTTTQRDLARTANSATTVKYAPAEQALGQELSQAQGVARDSNAWYDNYLAERAKNAQNIVGYSTAANTAVQNLQAGTKGLDQAALDAQRTQANASAAPRAATPADLGPEASQAAAVRQAILAAVGAQVADAGRGANTYADTLAHAVAPTEKLSALTQAAGKVSDVRAKQTALKTEEGAYNTSVRQQGVADEFKNVLAAQVAGVNTAKTKADTASTTTKTAKTAADIAFFNKHGYYPRTGPAPTPKAPDQMTGPGAKYGYTRDEWAKLSVSQRQKIIKDFKGSKDKPKDAATQYAKDFYDKYGVRPASTAAVGNAQNAIQTAASYVKQLKAGGADRSTIKQVLLNSAPVPTDQKDAKGNPKTKTYPQQKALWLTVALDQAWFNGRISAGTAKKLHAAGYSVKLLGLTTGAPTVVGPKSLPSGGTGSGGSAPPK